MNTRSFLIIGFVAACGGTESPPETNEPRASKEALSIHCDSTANFAAPRDAFVCGERRTLECTSPNGTRAPELHIFAPTCDAPLSLDPLGPYALGEQHLTVFEPEGLEPRQALCTATIEVVDSTPPKIIDHLLPLWPATEQMVEVTPEMCAAVGDVCDPNVGAYFTSLESDEAIAGDVDNFNCNSVNLRAKRDHDGDGRVYTLGLRAIDASGNVTEGSCTVLVSHHGNQRSAVRGPTVRRLYPQC